MNRPRTTLFMLVSVDGKISTGSSDDRDFDKDLPCINGVREGLYQYYDLEKKTDMHSFNTGRVMAKIGVNSRPMPKESLPCSFIILDNTHLTERGVRYLMQWTRKLYLLTTNKNHPAFSVQKNDSLQIVYCAKQNLKRAFIDLKDNYGIKRITLQSGGTMNAELLRNGLVDNLSIVVAPMLVGGKDTSSLIDGKSLVSKSDLKHIKALKLVVCKKLKNSYLHLKYKIIN